MKNMLTIAGKKAPLLKYLPDNGKRWVVCFSGALFCFFQLIQSNMMNSLNGPLTQEFSISAEQIGYISTAYFYSNVLFLFLAGVFIDYISRRTILIFVCSLNVLSVFCFAISQAPWQIFICHFVTGLAGTFSLISCMRLATRWFPPRLLATITGLMTGFSGLGGIVAQVPFTISINALGWRNTMFLNTALGFFILIIIFSFVQDHPDARETKNETELLALDHLKKVLKKICTNTQNWLAGFCAGLLNLPAFLLGALWGNLYLVQAHHLNSESAALVTSMLFVGGIIGGPVLGWISDRLSTRKIPMQVCAILGLVISLYVLKSTSSSIILFSTIFFLWGFVSGAQAVAYSFVTENNQKNILSSAQGFMATLMMAFGFLQSLFSFLMQWRWKGEYEGDMPLYAKADYHRAMLIFPIAYILAFLIMWWMREAKENKKSKKSS